jgi:exosortase H (IPTLxxWG-CTERM-specific)
MSGMERRRKGRGETGRSGGNEISERFEEHKGVFVFLLVFGVLMAGFYAFICYVPVYNYRILPAYHRFIAETSARMLSFVGERATATGDVIFSPRFSARIVPGCDAVEATALFVCAVLAFPTGLPRKVVGILAGAFALAVLNLVRVTSLFLFGVHLPRIFNMMHLEVWQGLFIVFAVVLWIVWLVWIVRNTVRVQMRPSKPSRF